jgi:AcrR family transcriptional regulator
MVLSSTGDYMIDTLPEKKEDLRIVRTKKSLTEALFKLLVESDFSSISVIDICEAANVHRATFYKHFKDKDDFLKFFIYDMVSRFKLKDDCTAEQFIDCYMAMLEDVLTYLNEKRNMFNLLFEKAPNTLILDKLYAEIQKMVIHRIENNIKNGMVYIIPEQIISAYFTGAFISLLKWWVTNDNPYTKNQMKAYMCMLVEGSLVSTIDGSGKSIV